MTYYRHQERYLVSLCSDLPFTPVPDVPEGVPLVYGLSRPPQVGRTAFCVSHPGQLSAKTEDVRFLTSNAWTDDAPSLPPALLRQIDARALTAVNVRHPHWQEALDFFSPQSRRRRVHLLAVGDVGGTLLTGLKLLGGDCISTVGICDLNEKTVQRWVAEMGQVSWPWDYDALPKVEAVSPEELFHCDVFIFAATKSIPPVGSAVQDVRMAQLEANRAIVEHYAQQARKNRFGGLFIVLSDPVDPLCKAAYLASNRGGDGTWDGQGLLAEQIQGFGLGVMNARAAALAQQESRYQQFLDEGRSFGPHGQGLVIANSVEHYDDGVSQSLTEEVLSANLRIRELGFKPYVAPALSSGVMQLLLTLRGQWHCGSVCLGDVWFGCRNRWTPAGLETETLPLPSPLFARLEDTQRILRQVL